MGTIHHLPVDPPQPPSVSLTLQRVAEVHAIWLTAKGCTVAGLEASSYPYFSGPVADAAGLLSRP
jgi:hypothetical protein